jgi:hypothetical protein
VGEAGRRVDLDPLQVDRTNSPGWSRTIACSFESREIRLSQAIEALCAPVGTQAPSARNGVVRTRRISADRNGANRSDRIVDLLGAIQNRAVPERSLFPTDMCAGALRLPCSRAKPRFHPPPRPAGLHMGCNRRCRNQLRPMEGAASTHFITSEIRRGHVRKANGRKGRNQQISGCERTEPARLRGEVFPRSDFVMTFHGRNRPISKGSRCGIRGARDMESRDGDLPPDRPRDRR